MRPFVENFPFFSIFLAILAAIVTAAIRSGRISYWITIGVCAASALLNGWVLEYTYAEGVSFTYAMGRFLAPYGNAINCGPLQALLAAVFSLVMALALAGGRWDLFQDILPEKQKFYFVMAKDNGPNLIATIRYLFMSLVGSGLFLIGLTILNSITGYLLMPSLAEAVAELRLSESYTLPLTVAVGLLVAGLGVKSAMFPFHLWLPDAHGGATTASSAILSGLVLKGYIVLLLVMILRVFSMELMVELGVTDVILAFGLLGMILGSLAAMRENHIKRMLAYSSVAQVGYIFMGVGLGSIEGLIASCFHILVHACCKPLLFLCAGRLSAVSGHHKSLKNLRGSAYRDIGAGLGFTVGALSMIGIPLFGGFVSKLYFASAAVPTGMTAMSTVLNALYYVPALLAIWVKPPAEDEALVLADVHPGDLAADRAFTAAAAILIVGIFVLGIFYHPITDLIEAGVRLI